MTPRQLLEKHNGDPLAAADDYDGIMELNVSFKETIDLLPYPWPIDGFVEATIAHLGEDGAEKWGRALRQVLQIGGRPKFGRYPIKLLDFTRIANATARERLAACLVALAEVERDA